MSFATKLILIRFDCISVRSLAHQVIVQRFACPSFQHITSIVCHISGWNAGRCPIVGRIHSRNEISHWTRHSNSRVSPPFKYINRFFMSANENTIYKIKYFIYIWKTFNRRHVSNTKLLFIQLSKWNRYIRNIRIQASTMLYIQFLEKQNQCKISAHLSHSQRNEFNYDKLRRVH